MTTNKRLSVARITQSRHLQTCGYWLLVQEDGRSHTAFATLAGLLQWAQERGLTIPIMLPREGRHDDLSDDRHAWTPIIGAYREQMHMDESEFDAIKPMLETRTLSNGDYVVAKITLDSDGIRTVHTLNPNVRNRHVYEYAESREMMK